MRLPFPLLPGRRRAGRRPPRRPGRRGDRGASAVEFALVSPLLFTLLFGAIDYGLYFADVQTVQQATADAAREATLSVNSSGVNWTGTTGCMGALPVSALAKVACGLSSSAKPLGGGVVYAKVEIVDSAGNPQTLWQPGNRLRVCTLTRHPAVLPFVPMPDAGLISARVDMPIQPGGPAALALASVEQNVTGIGATWSWC